MNSGRRKGGKIVYESHHIIPRSFGGSNKKDNLVLLTPREHILCHLLLVRMVESQNLKSKMTKALVRMLGNKRYDPQCSLRTVAKVRELHSQSMRGSGNPRFGKIGTMNGKNHSALTKEKMSESKIGKNNSFYGKQHSQKTKDTIRNKNSKPILCVTNNVLYNSQVEAASLLNLKQGDISNCLAGRQKTVKGYSFKFA